MPPVVWLLLLIGAAFYVWWLAHRPKWTHVNPWARYPLAVLAGIVVMYAVAGVIALLAGF